MSAYFKTVIRSIKNNIGRMIAVIAIIFIGLAFISGLGTLSPIIEKSFDEQLRRQNYADVIVKASSPAGFSQAEIDAFLSHSSVTEAQALTVIDMPIGGENGRLCVFDETLSINQLTVIEGSLPTNSRQIAVERAPDGAREKQVGERVSIFGVDYEISGVVQSPLIFIVTGESDLINRRPLDIIAYVNRAELLPTLPLTDLYLKIDGADGEALFSDDYLKCVDGAIDLLKGTNAAYGEQYTYLTREQNASCATLVSYCDKVSLITLIFPLFFFAVAALVVMTTMKRMVEEERSFLGCYKSLGVSESKITFKYVCFSLICCTAAALGGIPCGLFLVPSVVYNAFSSLFFLPVMSGSFYILPAALALSAMLTVVVGVTFAVVRAGLKGQPAELLIPKAPKAGKKTILEKITFLWKRLPFKYKSSYRNIFRNLGHFFMTVISVAGSTALVFAGFALGDVAKGENVPASLTGTAETLKPISAVIIVFALLLCVFVVYNLTNMNIGERRREIASLKVLGYRNVEVVGYIYREIFTMTFIGILVGIPLGLGLMAFLLYVLEIGAISDIMWYSYLVSGVCVIAFIAAIDLILVPKIMRVDMVCSLKSVN